MAASKAVVEALIEKTAAERLEWEVSTSTGISQWWLATHGDLQFILYSDGKLDGKLLVEGKNTSGSEDLRRVGKLIAERPLTAKLVDLLNQVAPHSVRWTADEAIDEAYKCLTDS